MFLVFVVVLSVLVFLRNVCKQVVFKLHLLGGESEIIPTHTRTTQKKHGWAKETTDGIHGPD